MRLDSKGYDDTFKQFSSISMRQFGGPEFPRLNILN